MVFTERIWQEVQAFFVSMFKSVWSGFTEMIPSAAGKILDSVLEFLGSVEENQWEAMAKYFEKVGMLSPEAAEEIQKMKDFGHPFDVLFYFMTFQALVQTYLQENILASAGDFRKAIYSKYTPSAPSPNDVMRAAFIAPEVTQRVRDIMKENGFSDEDIDMMFLANYRLYDEIMVRELYLRKVLNDDQVFMRMRELGYTDTRTREIVQSWQVIPPINDILRMVGREAFEPDMYEKMGLNQEFPEEQAEWFEKQGLSRFWQEKYWMAHWEQPSLQMGFEMLHRRVIDVETLDLIYKAVEIPPYWRDKLTAISYVPITRVDARRMHQLGVLSDEDLVGVYMDGGYSEENARRMALFTIRYNQKEESDLNKTDILKAYKDNVMSKADAKELLVSIHLTEDLADYYLTYQDFLKQKELEDAMIAAVGERYTNRLIERTDAKDALDKMNLPSIQVTELLAKWDVKLLKDNKVPSKTDLDKFLKKKIITKERYIEEMSRLGYNFTYTSWYYELSTGKKV